MIGTASNFIDAADIPLPAEYGVVRAVLVDPGAQAGRAHGERHQSLVAGGGSRTGIAVQASPADGAIVWPERSVWILTRSLPMVPVVLPYPSWYVFMLLLPIVPLVPP